METIGGERPVEQRKSFDVMASVDMFRFDIQRFGHVLPETRQRVCDEEMSLMSEGIDRASRTSFNLTRQGDELVYFDQATWRPYTGMLMTGLEVARQEAAQDPKRQFLVEWAERDLSIGYRMRGLKPGERMTWTNQYPQDIEDRYGAAFIKACGLSPERKTGFIYQATGQADGSVRLESQTIDRNDHQGFANVAERVARDPGVTLDKLVSVYDQTLREKYKTEFYAGRLGAEKYENAWAELMKHGDLMQYFLHELERLAGLDTPRSVIEQQVTQHVIGTWKAFKLRLDGKTKPITNWASAPAGFHHGQLAMEVKISYTQARRNGETKTGCGGSIKASYDESDPINLDATFDSIFGKEPEHDDEEDKYGSLTFKCKDGHTNKRPRNKLIEKCQTCKKSVRC